MQWVLLYIILSNPTGERPIPVVKYDDELFVSKTECEETFRTGKFRKVNGEIVAFCLEIKPMMLSPRQALP